MILDLEVLNKSLVLLASQKRGVRVIATRSRATHRQETMQKIADQRESGQGLLTCVIMLRVGSNSKSRKSSSEQ